MGKSIKLKDDIYWDGSSIKGKLVIDDVECKNVLNITTISGTVNGIIYSYDSNTNVITLNGTCTADNSKVTLNNDSITFNGDYTLSYEYVSGSISNITSTTQIQFQNSTSYKGLIVKLSNENNSKTSNLSNLTINAFRIRFDNGVVFNNYKIKIQLEKGKVATNCVPHKEYDNAIVYQALASQLNVITKNTMSEYEVTFNGSLTGRYIFMFMAVLNGGYGVAGAFTLNGGEIVNKTTFFNNTTAGTVTITPSTTGFTIRFDRNYTNCTIISPNVALT